MVTTNDRELSSRIWSLKDHGKRLEIESEAERPPGFRWLHDDFGTNARMIEVQAAIGRIQQQRMGRWTAQRTANSGALSAALVPFSGPTGAVRVPRLRCEPCPEGVPDPSQHEAGCLHARYKFYAYVNPGNLAGGWTRDRIVAEINSRGVPCYQGSCPEVYLEKAFDGTGWRPTQRLPVAWELGETSLMWLVHPTLTQAEIEKTCTY